MQDFAAPTTTQAPTAPAVPAPVRVVARDGRVFDVDTPEQASALLGQTDPGTGGALFTLDTPEAAAERRRQRTYGGAGGQALAGLAGAARGATVGLSDAAASGVDALAGTDITGDLEALREVNPGLSALGEVGGAVAPLLFSGGGSMLARGGVEAAQLGRGGTSVLGSLLRAGTAPARVVEGLAGAAEAGTLARLGTAGSESLLVRSLGRAASMGAGGAVEGAAMGLQQSITEAALGDAPLTAEQVLANVGLNALLGGATGGVLGTGAEMVLSGSRGARDVMARAFREATGMDLRRGVAEAWGQAADGISQASSLATGGEARAIREAIGPEGAAVRRDYALGEQMYEQATRELTPAIETVERGARRATEQWGRGMKPDQIRRLISTDRMADQLVNAQAIIGDARSMAQRVIDEARGNASFEVSGMASRARDLMTITNAADEMVRRAGTHANAADVSTSIFTALDELKRGMGRVQGRVEALDRGSSFLAELRGENGYERLRRTLEDESLWGTGAAQAQRDVNQQFTRFLTTRQRYMREFLGHSERDALNAFDALPMPDSRNMDSFVRATGAARNDTRAQVFRDTLDAQADLMETMGRHLDLGDNTAQVSEAVAEARRARAGFDELEGRVGRVNQLRALEAGSGIERTLLAQGAGYVLGGPLGAALATALASPTVLARGLGAIERAAQRVTSRIDSGASSFVRRALESARTGAVAGARRAGTIGRRVIVRASVQEFDEEVDRVLEASTQPQETQRRIAARTDDIGRVAPSIQQAMQQQATAGLAYLAQRIPPNARPPSALLPGITRRREASAPDRARFLRYARAVNDPLSVLDDLEAGSVPPESMEVLRDLFPRLHRQVGAAFMRELANRARQGDEVPFSFRRDLSSLLGAALDPMFTPQAIAASQRDSTAAAQQQQAAETRRFSTSDADALSGLADNEMTALARRELSRGG